MKQIQLKTQSFWMFLLLVIGATQNNFAQTFTANGQGAYESGTHDGFFYSFWSEGGGQVTMTLGPDGNYTTNWTNIQNFTGGKGWRTGSRDKVICFEGSYDGGSNGFLAVYGWTTDDLIEYYVVEDHGQWRPPGNTSDIETFGTVESDGGVYDIYRSRRVDKPSIIGNATFYQFWSVRRTKRSSGTVTFENHVNAWEATGLQLGTTWDYMIMESEGYGSSGSSNITVWECVTCTTPAPTVAPVVNYELNDPASPLTASGTSLIWYTEATGGTGSNTAPTPNTSETGITVYYVSSMGNDCESPRSSITVNVINTYKINKISSPIIIDGVVDNEWYNELIEPMEATKLLTGTVSDDSDLSGYGKMLWDETNLYLLAVITDESQYNDSENSYDDDQVEFYIDVDNAKSATYDANDFQYSFGWDDGSIVGVIPSTGPTSGITYASVTTDDGYIIEATIPWSTLSLNPTIGNLIGVDFMINDDDDGNERNGKISWNAGTDDAWQNASLFGVAILNGEEIITNINGDQHQTFSIYPNPTNSSVHLNKEYDWELYNTYGTLLTSGSGNELSLEEYTSGLYFLKVNNQVVQVLKK